MENNHTLEVLNDLVEILNDRVEGYEKAKKELEGKEPDLNQLCLDMIDQSRTLRNELGMEVEQLKGEITGTTTAKGNIYRLWMDLKSAFSSSNRKSVLEECEYGEDAAQKAYKSALADENLPAHIRTMIETQKQTLRTAHDKVKGLRDAVQA